MKKHLLLALLPLLALSAAAQTNHQEPHKKNQSQPAVTEMVQDLSVQQKRKIESLTRESKERTDALRQQQRAVRDSIKMYIDLDGDQSARLYPLFDREAALQAAVSREMYTTKLRIDAVLTPNQRAMLRKGKK